MWATPKKPQPKAPDHRPITCLITMYKSITPLVGEYLPLKTLQMDQRGGRPGVMGCTDNMLIDRMILEDAKMNKKNLSMVWTDVRKAFDSVTHALILKVLSMNKTNKRIIKFVENIMKGWKISITIDTVNGKEQLEPINVKRGILQKDSFVVKLFILCLDPIAWTIRGYEGYQLTHDRTMKITHLSFVDDLKLYAKSENKISVVTKKVKEMYEDIGMSWGLEKCASLHVVRGKVSKSEDLPIGAKDSISVMESSNKYKFLAKYENFEQLDKFTFQQAEKENLRRLNVIWSSPLSVPRKQTACIVFALPTLEYFMGTSNWLIADIQNLDRKSRKVVEMHKGKHISESIAMLYLPQKCCGRGFKSVEDTYKISKIKVVHHINISKDPRIKLVRSFKKLQKQKELQVNFC